jgi:hypothetical protein
MIKVCLADNYRVHFGVKSYFKDHEEISMLPMLEIF